MTLTSDTLIAPLGGETYQEVYDHSGNQVTLTYNDLWMMIICQTSMSGDWVRTRKAARKAVDVFGKSLLADRLWELEQVMGGLPEIPAGVLKLHTHRAYYWFKEMPVSIYKRW